MSHSSPLMSPSPPGQRRHGFAPRCERCCWTVVTHLPLVFVYGLTTWAVYVEIRVSLFWIMRSRLGIIPLLLGPLLYTLLNWSYTTAVFTDPGSPLSSPSNASRSGYSHLPTQEPSSRSHPSPTSFTVKSTGGMRFCKKCQTRKPDRAHHCSTCRRCVLKMDHHCPWLATCVGLRNYKAFLLFCGYTTLFCWACFGAAGTWFWSEIMAPVRNGIDGETNDLFSVNVIILAVLSGILGLVLAGFTGWHFSLAVRGQTTIECLEKTRYLSPLRKSMQKQSPGGAGRHYGGSRRGSEEGVIQTMQRYGQQLAEIHTNAIPGVTRVEEGEERASPTPDSPDLEDGRPGRMMTAREALSNISYADMERERERKRYEDYLDEKDSEKLPSAFDLGWKRNLQDLFGEVWYLRFFPVCNSKGDGWVWEASEKWLEARERIKAERESTGMRYGNDEHANGSYGPGNYANGYAQNIAPRRHYVAREPIAQPRGYHQYREEEDEDEGAEPYVRPGSSLSMRTIRRKSSFGGRSDEDDTDYESSFGQRLHEASLEDGAEEPDRVRQAARRSGGEDHWSRWD